MTKVRSVRARSTLFAALSLAAVVMAGLPATAATAASGPSTAAVMNQAGHALTAQASEIQVGADALEDASARCEDHQACLYLGTDYTIGFKRLFVSDGVGVWLVARTDAGLIFAWRSAKNHFDNRRLQIARPRADGSKEIVRCLNPNSQLPGPFPDESIYVRIGVLNSKC